MTHPDTLQIPRAVVEQAIEALEQLMRWQVKNVKVWNNSSYDYADSKAKALRAALQPQAATAPITCQYCHSDSGEVMWHCNNCGNKDQPYTTPPATQAEPVIPAGFALVPIRATAAMVEAFSEEGWEWANVLAAAEAVTEGEYEAALEGTPPATQAAPVSLQAAHDAVTIDTLNYRVMRQQAALTAALKCLHKLDIIEDTPDAAMRDAAITQIEALGVKHGSV